MLMSLRVVMIKMWTTMDSEMLIYTATVILLLTGISVGVRLCLAYN